MLHGIQILKFVSEMVAHELMDYNLPKAHRQEGEQADDELCLHGEPDLRGTHVCWTKMMFFELPKGCDQ